MGYRITDADVRNVVETDPAVASMLPFIVAAEAITNYVVTQDAANPLTANLTSDQVFTIEQYLAAWLYSTRDLPYSQKATATGGGSASGTFQGQTGMHLTSNYFGQVAVLLDTSGTLARLDKEAKDGGHPKVGLLWLGKSCRPGGATVGPIATPNRTY